MVGYEVKTDGEEISIKMKLCEGQGDLTGEIQGRFEPRMAQSLADDIYAKLEEIEETEEEVEGIYEMTSIMCPECGEIKPEPNYEDLDDVDYILCRDCGTNAPKEEWENMEKENESIVQCPECSYKATIPNYENINPFAWIYCKKCSTNTPKEKWKKLDGDDDTANDGYDVPTIVRCPRCYKMLMKSKYEEKDDDESIHCEMCGATPPKEEWIEGDKEDMEEELQEIFEG